ncbi:MAG: hypothetical protein LBT80_05270 [Lactobacillaceae bacterium]|jgi:hypothetical protein|nr:hypothetical protein [Lactobacillaceae bacterium]
MANLDALVIYNQPADTFIKYNEAGELQAAINAAITDDTFAIVIRGDAFISMTYGEWETLRVQQANEMIHSKLPTDNPAVAALFDTLSTGMAVKYKGAKSWNAIYEDLLASIEAITK